MSMPFYVSPEQYLKDRADYARKGIARGRSVVVLSCADGILFVTHNPSRALHKVSEIYDRIAFAAVGKYHEFEALRVAGIRYADMRGFSYDRSDVTVRALANSYAQTLGSVFSSETKPLEVELVVAEVGAEVSQDQLYRLSFDGGLGEEYGHVVIGGEAEARARTLAAAWSAQLDLGAAIRLALAALEGGDGPIPADQVEAAILDRPRPAGPDAQPEAAMAPPRRLFRRLTAVEIAGTR